ncbi:MAG: GNAT family N-acetyltransferase [Dehalococcoidia bacterium]|nr:GNAT family N-acetyltransferase [Dehalococcoidia bacterium]
MAVEVRHCTPAEMDAFFAVPTYVFGMSYDAQDEWAELNKIEGQYPTSATMAAFVDGRIASTLGAHDWRTRVNGRSVPTACVTTVGTMPEFRRQGYQRLVMARSLEWHREAGQPLAMLWASFGAIYQRYGYGLASAHTMYTFDPRFVALRDPDPPSQDGYAVRLVDAATHRPLVERLYEAYIAPRTLAIERDSVHWEVYWHWEVARRKDRTKYVAIAYDGEAAPQGFLIYSTAEDMGAPFQPGPDQSMEVEQFIPLTLEAHRAMWNYIRSHDLVRQVKLGFVPEDDPTVDMLLEPRELQRRTGDGMWLRIVDVAAALEARGYETDARGSVTIAVRDDLCPWNTGTYRLSVEGGQATVRPASGAPDLAMPVAALSPLYSGFRTATQLARGGRIEGDREALQRADALFRTAYRPHVLEGF